MTPPVQSAYQQYHDAALAGLVANQVGMDIKSATAISALVFGSGVNYNLAVERQCQLPAGAGRFMGVAVRDLSLQGDAAGVTAYEIGDEVAVLIAGEVWVTAGEVITQGDSLFSVHTSGDSEPGEFRSDADTANAVQVVGGSFLTSAGAGELVKIQIPYRN